MRRYVSFALISLAGLSPACAIVAPNQASTTAGEIPQSDAILVDWHMCDDAAPCMTGTFNGKPYALGFHESPAVVVGKLGGRAVEYRLEPDSVFRLGDHALDLLFTDASRRSALSLTWNELRQKPIEARLYDVIQR